MSELKAGQPFGIDKQYIEAADWNLALARVVHDLRSDFIWAPHLRFLYKNAGDEIVGALKSKLLSGKYYPGLPLTLEVPKSYRVRVATKTPRRGPNYSRPGSILMPQDRIFYQMLANQAAPLIDAATDKTRSFGHWIGAANSSEMFLPTRTCWSGLQAALKKHSRKPKNRYVLKLDVSNFFGSLNLHTLTSLLIDHNYPTGLSSRLEAVLTTLTGSRSSRGLIQGLYPSDLLGDFYLSGIDLFLSERGVDSARYVDDLYIFLPSVDAGAKIMRDLIPKLRSYDLSLNEAKSAIIPKAQFITEEPDLQELFDEAVEEIRDQLSDADFDVDYGMQSEWEEDEEDEESLSLSATQALFDSMSKYPGQEENIERFCIPLFTKASSGYAVGPKSERNFT